MFYIFINQKSQLIVIKQKSQNYTEINVRKSKQLWFNNIILVLIKVPVKEL